MQVIVTGASGFLGKHLVPALAVAGHGGVAVSRQVAGSLPPQWRGATRPEFLGSAPAGVVEWVVHLEVKQHNPQPTVRDTVEFVRVNVEGTAEWLNWCSRNDVAKFVYFSSIKAVQTRADGPTDECVIGLPDTPYGLSKWKAEKLVREWTAADSRRASLILRPAVIYGEGNRGNLAAMACAIQRGRFFLAGQNKNIKSLVAVENVCAAVCHLIKQARPGSCEVFNLVDAKTYSVRAIDRMLRERCGKKGNSPSIPIGLARMAAMGGDLLAKVARRPMPFNSSVLSALTENTDFSCDKLLATGFTHPVKPLSGF